MHSGKVVDSLMRGLENTQELKPSRTLFPLILGTALHSKFITALTLIELSHPAGLDSLQRLNIEEIPLLLPCFAPRTSMEMLPLRALVLFLQLEKHSQIWSVETHRALTPQETLKRDCPLKQDLDGFSQGLSLEIRSKQQVLEAKDKEVHQGVS